MRIIGLTGHKGYILSATHEELLRAAGYRHSWDAKGEVAGLDSHRDAFAIGTDIKVSLTLEYLHDLRSKEADVAKAETLLRALADMLHGALPTTIVPPPEGVV